jgi:hypothetical protein
MFFLAGATYQTNTDYCTRRLLSPCIRRQRVPTAFSPLLIFPRTTSSTQPTLLGGPGEQTYHHPAVPQLLQRISTCAPFHANYLLIHCKSSIFYFILICRQVDRFAIATPVVVPSVQHPRRPSLRRASGGGGANISENGLSTAALHAVSLAHIVP